MVSRYIFLILCLTLSINLSAQFQDTGYCSKKPPIDISVTVNGFEFADKVYISKDTLKNGFSLKTAQADYNIMGFRVYFYGKYMDLYWKDITGNRATQENLPILRSLHGDELMEIECINLRKDKNLYIARHFIIIIPEK